MPLNLSNWFEHAPTLWYVFWVIASGMSLFYAFKAYDALAVNVDLGRKPWAWKFHQWWFNLCGSLVGWGSLWLVFRKVCVYPSPIGRFDVLLMAVAFVGITGHLPFAVMGFLRAIEKLAFKVLGYVTDDK